MSDEPGIRESVDTDIAEIESLYPAAFPDEDLLPLVRSLLEDAAVSTSLVAQIDSQIAGHIIFTKCALDNSGINPSLLGPLAVGPSWQSRGIGSALVRAGLKRLREEDVDLVCVLGDPAYYGRLGFTPESFVRPPFPLPGEWIDAWQSMYLPNAANPCAGKLTVPPQWMQPDLWAP